MPGHGRERAAAAHRRGPTAPAACRGCDARCCRRYTISVHHAEVMRIARHTGLAPEDVVELETTDLSPVFPVVRVGGVQGQIALRREGVDGRCRFLDGAANRCTIHGRAPFTCRAYPLVLTGDAGALGCRLRDDPLCPEPFAVGPEEEEELRRAARRFWGRELPAYQRRVWAWNVALSQGDLREFLAFCRRKLVIPKGRMPAR